MNQNHEREAGEAIKQNILQTLAARRECYVVKGRRALLERLLSHGMATADDVRRAIELPTDIDPRCLGSVPGHLARAGIIRGIGYEKSGRRERHASIIAVWELADDAAARGWLARHPAYLDDGRTPPALPL